MSAITDSGKRNILIAGFPAEFGLLYNAMIAKEQGYNVWAVVDSSPSYDAIGSASALA